MEFIGSVGGIIPAYAGSTPSIPRYLTACRGSSPHTRGALDGLLAEAGAAGIIPAYAGSTRTPSHSGCSHSGSSPHTRGAHVGRARQGGRRGDHPRIRGEHLESHARQKGTRGIIPAYAGSTVLASAIAAPFLGSSPHTRGAHLFTCDPNSRRGSFVSLHPKRRALCLLLASLQPDFLAP